MKIPNIASGDPQELLAALENKKPAKDDQGQSARDIMPNLPDECQGQQAVEPMQSQPNYIRNDESLRPSPALKPQEGELPPQFPNGDPDELLPSIVPSAQPSSRKP
jgi:hypothetical protein